MEEEDNAEDEEEVDVTQVENEEAYEENLASENGEDLVDTYSSIPTSSLIARPAGYQTPADTEPSSPENSHSNPPASPPERCQSQESYSSINDLPDPERGGANPVSLLSPMLQQCPKKNLFSERLISKIIINENIFA